MRITGLVFIIILTLSLSASVQNLEFEKDVFTTDKGDLEIYFVGHGTLFIRFDEMNIHIDPVGRYADYSKMPEANLILITHEHGDHLDNTAIEAIGRKWTAMLMTEKCKESYSGSVGYNILKNGQSYTWEKGIVIEAVPAYNIKHMRGPDAPFHPKGVGNGYVLHLGGKRVYIAGDTENTLEMKALENIDIAFLPMNVPYTMTPEMVADAALAFKPTVLYPYHFGNTDTSKLIDLLKDSTIDVRIRDLK